MRRGAVSRVIVVVLAVVAGWSPAIPATGGDGARVERVAGADRTATAALLAARHGDADTVVVASAADFPDALAGAVLGHPVLLSDPATLSPATAEALEDLAPSSAVLLGGTAALGTAVEEAVADLVPDVRRLAGDGRVDTAAAVALQGGRDVGTVGGRRTAFVANAGTFADALAASPVSAALGLPVLLTEADMLPAATTDALDALDITQVVVVGGTAAVSPDVLGQLQSGGRDVIRLAGPTRQATAVTVARWAHDTLGWRPTEIVLADGGDFPDALAAGPLAGARQAPLLLTGAVDAVDAVDAAAGLLGCRATTVLVAGGTAAISEAQAEAVRAALATAEACTLAPTITPTQAVLAVGDTHEVAVDVYGAAGLRGMGSGEASTDGPVVSFAVVPDTLSRAMATIVADDLPPGPGGGGGAEIVTMAGPDGTAAARFTSSTPGLAVVRACVGAGPDTPVEEQVCLDTAVQFSARYVATIGESGAGWVSLDTDGRLCAALVDVEADGISLVDADGTVVATIDDGTGCVDDVGTTQAAVDADPASLGVLVDGERYPLAVVGSDYAEWEPGETLPFVSSPLTSSNTELVATIAGLTDVTAINFIDHGDRDVLYATGRFGLRTYDITDPAAPELLDWLEMPDFWENEDMDIDVERRLVVLSRDPRAFGGSTDDGVAGLYLVDASDPEALRRIVFHELPAGHTATCVPSTRNDGTTAPCDFLWSGGPATGAHQPEDWGGRPVFVTDIRDPEKPFTHPVPLVTEQNDGVTDYAHDVQVDADGIAWVSARGGVYGYHTTGTHTDPLTGEERTATPVDPVPFAGGTLEGEDASGGLIHNSSRPVGDEADQGADLEASGFAEGELVYATDEAFTSACTTDGLFNIVTLEGSYAGEGFTSTPEAPFRLRTVGTWSPVTAGEPGPIPLCSAHYFDMRDGIVAYSWYGQGTRFLDVTDPTDPIQVAFHRPLVNSSFAPRWRGDVVFVADSLRGIDVLRLTEGAATASATRQQIAAPPLPVLDPAAIAAATTGAPVPLGGRQFGPDPAYGWACWIPTRRS